MADNDWDKLVSDWQSSNPSTGKTAGSIADLRALELKTSKKARRMKFFMWADIIATVLSTIVFLYFVFFKDLNIQQIVIFIGVLFIIIPMGVYSVMVRRGLWEATGNDTYAYLELAKKRALAGIKLANANIMVAWIAIPFIIAVVIWRAIEKADTVSWPMNPYVGVIIFEVLLFSVIILGARYYRDKKQRELEQYDDMLKQFNQSD